MATSAAADQIVEVVTPAAGESVSEGTILEWHAKVGDFIKAADTIVEISTAEVDGVDLADVSGSGPAGRITKSDVLKAATADGARRAPEVDGNGSTATAAEPRAEPMRGGAAALARYMEESRAIPTATSFRTLTVTVLDARRRELKEAGQRVSFTHLIAYAIVRAGAQMPVMMNHFAEIDGQPHRIDDGQINLGLAVDVEKRDGSRTLMVPVIKDAAT